jgi:pimeloyl-ACP methyl ester carboxylesterase
MLRTYRHACGSASLALFISFESHDLKTYDGRTRTVELGQFHAGNDVRVGFYRLETHRAGNTIPIVFLMGGPGIPGTVIAQVPPYFALFSKLSESADVIVLDQRGLGTGSPRLDCPPPPKPLPPDFLLSLDRLRAAYLEMTGACASHWRSKAADPGDYTIAAIADELAVLPRELKAPQLVLLAFSYGTRNALETIRRRPGLVRHVVFQGTNGPDQTIKLPHDFDASLRAIGADLEQTLRDTLKALRQQPAIMSVRSRGGSEVRLSVGAEPYANLR